MSGRYWLDFSGIVVRGLQNRHYFNIGKLLDSRISWNNGFYHRKVGRHLAVGKESAITLVSTQTGQVSECSALNRCFLSSNWTNVPPCAGPKTCWSATWPGPPSPGCLKYHKNRNQSMWCSELPFAHNTVASIYFLLYIMLSFISTGMGLYCDRKDATRGVQRRKAQTVFRTFGSGL